MAHIRDADYYVGLLMLYFIVTPPPIDMVGHGPYGVKLYRQSKRER